MRKLTSLWGRKSGVFALQEVITGLQQDVAFCSPHHEALRRRAQAWKKQER